MKTYKYMIAVAVMFGMTACVYDLNLQPKDPNTVQDFNKNAVFTKIYSTFGLTGQKGPNGDGDVDGIDEGTSSFYRMTWELNEFPADGGWWCWGTDAGVPDVRVMSWTTSNPLVSGLYYRLYFDITLCNHFLDKATETDTETIQQRAEVKFIRALNYWYLLDMFGSVPFNETMDADKRYQITRKDLYAWLEQQLLDSEKDLPDTRLSIYRVDKVAAQVLLARLYLNAEVYTGTPQWEKAEEYARKAMGSGYELLTDDSGSYTAYQKLFMGDNHKNGAQKEAVLLIYQDGVYANNWGGSRFCVNAFRDENDLPSGSDDSWTCFRASPEMVYTFVDASAATSKQGDEFEMPALLGDDRAILSSKAYGKNQASFDILPIEGAATDGTFDKCWRIMKWTGRYSDDAVGHDSSWPDTDIPLIRIAEAYMTCAEALLRQGKTSDALDVLNNNIRKRAHAADLTTLDEDIMLDEWQREFYSEGRRRSDLVRFGQFAGAGVTRTWEGRGGAASGAAIIAKDAKYNTYPIPEADVVASGLIQTNGWDK